MRRTVSVAVTLAALFISLLHGLPGYAGSPGHEATGEKEWREVFSPDGSISRVLIPKQEQRGLTEQERRRAATAEVVALQNSGPSDRRFDLVIVGDGYTAGQLGTLRAHAESKWAEVAQMDPFSRHRQNFNVWLVNVVSNQSGVDGDPSRGVQRDTALDMGFWCEGIERLLCLNEAKAMEYARRAPGVDVVLALGNTAKYGGAGYTGISTAAGGNAQAGRIAIHEFGHSVGGLADEYYTPGTTYSGSEPNYPNVTTASSGSKWASSIGRATPDGGTIGAYRGGNQYEYGIYRPSDNSMMRNLSQPFNLIGLDVLNRALRAKIIDGGDPDPGPQGCSGHGNTRTGSLATGGSAYQPDGASFHAGAGRHSACLTSPGGADFDVELLRWSGSAWQSVASGTAGGTGDRLTYDGSAGYYVYRIRATSGAGAYTLDFTTP